MREITTMMICEKITSHEPRSRPQGSVSREVIWPGVGWVFRYLRSRSPDPIHLGRTA